MITVLDSIFKTVGMPKRILTDNGTNYRSKKFQNFLTRLKISRSFSSAYHPQTNGANEKVNDTIVKGICIESVSHPKLKWSSLVSQVVENYNHTLHSTTGFTPAFLMFGSDRLKTSTPTVSEARLLAKQKSDQFKAKKKSEFDLKHKPFDLKIGDIVKRRVPLNHPDLKKLSPRFDAPFKVVSIIGPVNVAIARLDPNLTSTDSYQSIVVHVSQLDRYFVRGPPSDGGE